MFYYKTNKECQEIDININHDTNWVKVREDVIWFLFQHSTIWKSINVSTMPYHLKLICVCNLIYFAHLKNNNFSVSLDFTIL